MRRLILCVAIALLGGAAFAEAPLTNADVVKLVKAGISAETILTKIENSEVDFDTSTDALVALKNDAVPEAVIRAMVVRSPSNAEDSAVAAPSSSVTPGKSAAGTAAKSAPEAAVAPAAAGTPSPTPQFKMKRFLEVTIHSSKYAGCPGELAITSSGIESSRCRGVDFKLKWSEVASVCYAFKTKGFMVISTRAATHRVSTTAPIEMKEIRDAVRRAAPTVAETSNCQ